MPEHDQQDPVMLEASQINETRAPADAMLAIGR